MCSLNLKYNQKLFDFLNPNRKCQTEKICFNIHFLLLLDESDEDGNASENDDTGDDDPAVEGTADEDTDEPMDLTADDDILQNPESVDDTEEETRKAADAWEHPPANAPMSPGGKKRECKCKCRKFKTDKGNKRCIEQFTKEEQNEIR